PNPPFLIDVRTPSETAEQDNRIEGAHIIPLDTIRHALKHDADLREAKGGDVVIICRSGQRAGIAAWLMKRSGFEHCFILSGGIEAWKEDESGI
ncbi:MAG: rhodanese-like domain-containing protein, partial [Gammaproteobacteria bacterium]